MKGFMGKFCLTALLLIFLYRLTTEIIFPSEPKSEISYGLDEPFKEVPRKWATTLHTDGENRYLTLVERHHNDRVKHLNDPYFGTYRVDLPADCVLYPDVISTTGEQIHSMSVLFYKETKDSELTEIKPDIDRLFQTLCRPNYAKSKLTYTR